MFGSVAPILELAESGSEPAPVMDCNKVQAAALFRLLMGLEQELPDSLHILELVAGDKPLLPLVSTTLHVPGICSC
jgi:hypothetical protein